MSWFGFLGNWEEPEYDYASETKEAEYDYASETKEALDARFSLMAVDEELLVDQPIADQPSWHSDGTASESDDDEEEEKDRLRAEEKKQDEDLGPQLGGVGVVVGDRYFPPSRVREWAIAAAEEKDKRSKDDEEEAGSGGLIQEPEGGNMGAIAEEDEEESDEESDNEAREEYYNYLNVLSQYEEGGNAEEDEGEEYDNFDGDYENDDADHVENNEEEKKDEIPQDILAQMDVLADLLSSPNLFQYQKALVRMTKELQEFAEEGLPHNPESPEFEHYMANAIVCGGCDTVENLRLALVSFVNEEGVLDAIETIAEEEKAEAEEEVAEEEEGEEEEDEEEEGEEGGDMLSPLNSPLPSLKKKRDSLAPVPSGLSHRGRRISPRISSVPLTSSLRSSGKKPGAMDPKAPGYVMPLLARKDKLAPLAKFSKAAKMIASIRTVSRRRKFSQKNRDSIMLLQEHFPAYARALIERDNEYIPPSPMASPAVSKKKLSFATQSGSSHGGSSHRSRMDSSLFSMGPNDLQGIGNISMMFGGDSDFLSDSERSRLSASEGSRFSATERSQLSASEHSGVSAFTAKKRSLTRDSMVITEGDEDDESDDEEEEEEKLPKQVGRPQLFRSEGKGQGKLLFPVDSEEESGNTKRRSSASENRKRRSSGNELRLSNISNTSELSFASEGSIEADNWRFSVLSMDNSMAAMLQTYAGSRKPSEPEKSRKWRFSSYNMDSLYFDEGNEDEEEEDQRPSFYRHEGGLLNVRLSTTMEEESEEDSCEEEEGDDIVGALPGSDDAASPSNPTRPQLQRRDSDSSSDSMYVEEENTPDLKSCELFVHGIMHVEALHCIVAALEVVIGFGETVANVEDIFWRCTIASLVRDIEYGSDAEAIGFSLKVVRLLLTLEPTVIRRLVRGSLMPHLLRLRSYGRDEDLSMIEFEANQIIQLAEDTVSRLYQ